MGYIAFKYDRENKGILEVTNFNARLQLWHLAFGGTSKDHDPDQTGQHGEGFKMAGLTFLRTPYKHSFRVESSGFRWNFSFNTNRTMQCKLTRVDPKQIMKLKKQAAKEKDRMSKAQIWNDVSVIIGAPRKIRTSDGLSLKGSKIALADFEDLAQSYY